MSSGERIGVRKRGGLAIGLAGLTTAVEATEESIEQMALSGSMSIAGRPAPIVVGASTG